MKSENTLSVGIIGYGGRGRGVVNDVLLGLVPSEIEIVAVCDSYADRAECACEDVYKATGTKPAVFTDYRELCEKADVDAVFVFSAWEAHFDIAICAMKHGIAVGFEVGGAYSIDKLWQLVHTQEETGVNCMMLENCCYDYFELATAAMARSGALGTVVHGEGAYCHDLGDRWEPWRLRYNAVHRGDVYPTHGLGPVCLAMGMHRGDTLRTLVSMDTLPSPVVSERYGRLAREGGAEAAPADRPFANGAVTTTLMRSAQGRTILLGHNVQTPQPYSRGYRLVGTDGFACKYPAEQLWLDGREVAAGEVAALVDRYLPDDIRRLRPTAARYDNRGGISYLMDYRLVDCLLRGLPLDMDVYDLAEWCSVVELSELSVSHGSVPVAVPDFCRR